MIPISEVMSYKRIIVWGAGRAFQEGFNHSISVDYIVDSNELLNGTKIDGINIYTPNKLYDEDEESSIIIICSIYNYDIMKSCIKMGIRIRVIFSDDIFPCPFLLNSFKFNSYSLCSSDAIIQSLSERYCVPINHYVDVGSNHPYLGNATFAFYEKYGANGVLIEPNQQYTKMYKIYRPKDLVLSVGVGSDDEDNNTLEYYEIEGFEARNTFSKIVAESYKSRGINYKKTLRQIKCLNSILEEYGQTIDYISVDVESYEYMVLKDFNYRKFDVKFFNIEKGDDRVKSLLLHRGYDLACETIGDWIFVKSGMIREILPMIETEDDSNCLCNHNG